MSVDNPPPRDGPRRPLRLRRGLRSPSALVAALLTALAAVDAAPRPPPENRCPIVSGRVPGRARDAAPLPLREGMILKAADLLRISTLLPDEVWANRDAFFYEGMRMEIGPCHRRYPVPEFFSRTTQEFAGRARLDDENNLHDYKAGLPFPPDSIDPESKDAAAKWAWNLESRYRGAGPKGKFRIVDMPARLGSIQTYLGEFFFVQAHHRADLVQSDYALPNVKNTLWAAGGRFSDPFDARHLAWQQLRPISALTKFTQPDNTFVYVPTMRKSRRAATPWVDGMYTPRYRVAGDAGGGGIATGGNEFTGATGAVNPTAAESIKVSEYIRQGFTDISLRPNAYVWRLRGEREVLAPINSSRPGYPRTRDRNFGPSGLSVGSDRWDLRWAVVIEGAPRRRQGEIKRVMIYVDYQTQQPLYLITRGSGGRVVDVGIPVHRFSGDVIDYPPWPDGSPADVFDPVAAVFYTALDGSGWRRESYGIRSLPVSSKDIRRYTSSEYVARGR